MHAEKKPSLTIAQNTIFHTSEKVGEKTHPEMNPSHR
jgi:hypothetical protein